MEILIADGANQRNVYTKLSTDSKTKETQTAEKRIFCCPKCKMTFARGQNVRRHISNVHPSEADSLLVSTSKPKTYKYKCELCKRQFNKLNNYNYHRRKDHSESTPQRELEVISCPECHGTFQKKDIFSHYKQDHDLDLKTETLQFQTFEEFNIWKENISITSCSKFNLERTKKTLNVTLYYFICHRSGFFKPKGKGLRRLKSKGSAKIDSLCPSKIKVRQYIGGFCEVEYQSTHFGHQIDVNHLPLSHAERQSIVEKIAAKVPRDVILDEVNNSVLSSGVSRLHRVTKKDLHNIAASYYKKCRDDDSKRKIVSKLNEIKERHELSLNFQAEVVKHDEMWILKAIGLNEFCTVRENLLECPCELICTNCNVCMHKYSCSCVDSTVNLNMCKHIHFFCQYNHRERSDIAYVLVDVIPQDLGSDESNCKEIALNSLSYDNNNFEPCLNDKKLSLIEDYSNFINSLSSAEELDLVEKNLELLKTALTAALISE